MLVFLETTVVMIFVEALMEPGFRIWVSRFPLVLEDFRVEYLESYGLDTKGPRALTRVLVRTLVRPYNAVRSVTGTVLQQYSTIKCLILILCHFLGWKLKLQVSGIQAYSIPVLTQFAFAEEESQGLLRLVSYLTVGEQEAPHCCVCVCPRKVWMCGRFGRSWPHVTSSSPFEKLNGPTVPCEDSNNMSIDSKADINWG